MSSVHHIAAVLSQDGQLHLTGLPYQAGQAVEILVVPIDRKCSDSFSSLHGNVLCYDDPFAPVAEDDWSELR